MCQNGVLVPILSNYAAQLTTRIEGIDDRIFSKVLVDTESTNMRNAIARQLVKKAKKSSIVKGVTKELATEFD